MKNTRPLGDKSADRVNISLLTAYVYERNDVDNGFLQSIVELYQRNRRWCNWVSRSLAAIVAIVNCPKAGTIEYFFWGTKYQEIILSLPRHRVCIIGGPKQMIFCLRHRISFMPEMKLWSLMLSQLKDISSRNVEKKLVKHVLSIKQRISEARSPKAYLIVENDSLPVQRAIIQAARLGKVTNVVGVQHGIFQRSSPAHVLDGWLVDYFLTINENQKEILTEKGIPSAKLRVMGFHSSARVPKRALNDASCRKICFLGQPWNKYDANMARRYQCIIDESCDILREEGMDVYFKPHPWEHRSSYESQAPYAVDVSMSEAIERYDVFISLTSTALFEVADAGRIAIQVWDAVFNADRFSKHSSIISIDFDENFQYNLLEAVRSVAQQREGRVDSASARFLEAIKSI